jgi:ferredoxin
MIVTKGKELKVIKEYLAGSKSVAIIGCGACAAACQTGGKDDVEAMARVLKEGHDVSVAAVVDEACQHMLTRKQLKEHQNALAASDAILAMCCGAGVQCLSELFSEKKIIPASDTHILGNALRAGQFKSYCSLCGDCILGDTEGLCVKTRCPKNHLNGPCGGMADGKCEVHTDRDCVYVLIYNKRKDRGLSTAKKKVLHRDYSARIDELNLPRNP